MARVGDKPSITARYKTCTSDADAENITLFGLDNKRCWTSESDYSSYSKYGTSGTCKKNKLGKSGGFSEHGTIYVYQKDQQGDTDSTLTYICNSFILNNLIKQ